MGVHGYTAAQWEMRVPDWEIYVVWGTCPRTVTKSAFRTRIEAATQAKDGNSPTIMMASHSNGSPTAVPETGSLPMWQTTPRKEGNDAEGESVVAVNEAR